MGRAGPNDLVAAFFIELVTHTVSLGLDVERPVQTDVQVRDHQEGIGQIVGIFGSQHEIRQFVNGGGYIHVQLVQPVLADIQAVVDKGAAP